jgi:hypothetical protein
MNSHAVEYLIVGGHAVAYHGYPRYTGDLDFFIKPTPENVSRVVTVLREFGFGDTSGLEAFLLLPGKVLQLGRPPNRIDVLSGISGVGFDQALATCVATELDGIPVRMIGFDALVANKTASDRPKDRADVVQLQKVRRS